MIHRTSTSSTPSPVFDFEPEMGQGRPQTNFSRPSPTNGKNSVRFHLRLETLSADNPPQLCIPSNRRARDKTPTFCKFGQLGMDAEWTSTDPT